MAFTISTLLIIVSARAVRHFSIPAPDSPTLRAPDKARAKFVGIEHPTDTQIDVVITA
jgi:hypothetical protein